LSAENHFFPLSFFIQLIHFPAVFISPYNLAPPPFGPSPHTRLPNSAPVIVTNFLMSDLAVISSLVQRRATGAGRIIWLFDDDLILAECQLHISIHFTSNTTDWKLPEACLKDRPTESFNVSVCAAFSFSSLYRPQVFPPYCLHAAENKSWDKADKML